MLRFSRSNGITEGFHTKMEMISRRAFGFRNFNNLPFTGTCALRMGWGISLLEINHTRGIPRVDGVEPNSLLSSNFQSLLTNL